MADFTGPWGRGGGGAREQADQGRRPEGVVLRRRAVEDADMRRYRASSARAGSWNRPSRLSREKEEAMEAKIQKSDEEWASELTPEQYEVMRRHGTEPPFTGKYVYEKGSGMYRCAACDNELFASDTTFDSGTGWPSFTEPAVAEAVELH